MSKRIDVQSYKLTVQIAGLSMPATWYATVFTERSGEAGIIELLIALASVRKVGSATRDFRVQSIVFQKRPPPSDYTLTLLETGVLTASRAIRQQLGASDAELDQQEKVERARIDSTLRDKNLICSFQEYATKYRAKQRSEQ